VDAFATPFVQGRLRNEAVSIGVVTECALSKQPIHMEIDSDMNCSCDDPGCSPMIFVPDIDFKTLNEPHIIDAF
jgi:hypothetical protein